MGKPKLLSIYNYEKRRSDYEKKCHYKDFYRYYYGCLYTLLMFARNLGGFFHETVGLGIGILFVIHILLNYSMIKDLFKSVKSGKIQRKILLFSDIVLTICMPIVITTGILIAKELFVIWSDISWELLFNIHNVLSYVCLGIMVLHIILHAKYLLGVFKKLPSSLSGKEMMSAVSRFFAGAVAAVFIYSSLAIYKNIFDNQNFTEEPDSSNVTNIVSTSSTNNSNTYTEPTLPKIDEDNTTSITENTNSEYSITADDTTSPPPPTLEEYLSGLRCTGCSRRCFLLNPRCGKGELQASKAKEEYNRIYTV